MTDNSTLWNQFCKALAETKIIYTDPSGLEIAMPENIKPEVLSMAIQENSRARTLLATEALNFHSLQYRDNIRVDFPIGNYFYNGGDGLKEYCKFRTILESLIGFWAFVHRYHYPDIDKHLRSEEDFLNYLLPIFCPYGSSEAFKESMRRATGKARTYAQMCLEVYRDESVSELKKYGWEETYQPVIIQPPNLSEYYIDKGVIHGPNVKYSWVKNHELFLRPQTKGIIYHEPDARGTQRDFIGQGILNDWNNPKTGRSAHVVFHEDGTIIQCVNLLYPAWHCAGLNLETIGFEFCYLGPFWPWREILGWFFRWKGLPWEQSIRKSDCVLLNGMYWPKAGFTDAQIESGKIITALCRKEFGPLYGKGHSEVDNRRVDPGPLFPLDEMRELLV